MVVAIAHRDCCGTTVLSTASSIPAGGAYLYGYSAEIPLKAMTNYHSTLSNKIVCLGL